ncbi:hypothetical protein LTR35_017868 [Friedmanniomyces endolithicus]|nr:hypothetical protein LTR35_017868 [Friedmanniomyces endolithicus]KAK0267726.1 hypothetical protein LTS00_017738 [Friedmanniomyces endolithicus]KAK0970757.1 hypothetical protein LTR54_017913 [Friedmanniomyces endolithicus]
MSAFALFQISALASTGLAILIALAHRLIVAFLGPLGKVPGPWYTKVSNLPLKYATVSAQRVYFVHAIHMKYGPVVRVSPDEIHIADISAVREIHKIGSGYVKSDWYQHFTDSFSNPSIFPMIDPKEHGERRRLYASTFSTSFLKKVEPQIHTKVGLFLRGLKEEVERTGSTDILKWSVFMANDMISELSFGSSLQMLERREKNQYILDVQRSAAYLGVMSELRWLKPVMARVPAGLMRDLTQRRARMDRYAADAVERYRTSLIEDPDRALPTFFTKLLQSGELTDDTITHEAAGFIIAGSDTTANTFTYMVWAVLSNQNIRSRITAEIATLPEVFEDKDLKELGYLDCVLNETLRLYGAAPGFLPRIVPTGGRELCGYFLPAGTRVSTQSWSTHRDTQVFPNPEV